VVFDPSLLVPPSNLLFQGLLSDDNVSICLTGIMKDSLSSPSKLEELLRLWEAQPYDFQGWINKNVSFNKLKLMEPSVPQELRADLDMRLQTVGAPPEAAEFMSDEISLALSYTMPIFCTETSSFKIVQFLTRIGANIKDKIIAHGETKAAFFGQAEAWKKVLSGGLGAAFIWAFGGPTAGLLALGASGITIVIEDP
jgi:hypothetical protein